MGWVHASERLSLLHLGKASRGNAKVKTGIGKSDLPGLQGGPRKRDLVIYDKVRASRLYPDPREKRVGFCPSDSFLRVVLMLGSGTLQRDEGGGEKHFRIVATKLNGLFDESEAVEALGRIGGSFVDPLPLVQSLGEIAGVKGSERGFSGVSGRVRTGDEFEKKLLRSSRIALRVSV